jgi:3-oxoacyl-[acyl-carrier-protein] synthase-1
VEAALDEIGRGAEAVLVGGIDTWFDADALEHLDLALRLHGPDTENGFIPGEGAGFLLLASPHRAPAAQRLGQVIAAVVEPEPRPWGSDDPCLGEGITRAVRRACAAAGAEAAPIPWALTDVNNERHRVDEWMCAVGRNHRSFTAELVHEQPLLKTGDLGAASTAVLLAIAATRWQTRCAPGSRALIVTSSDGPERGAVVCAAPPS